MTTERPDFDNYYMSLARTVASRSTCLRIPSGVGCVLVLGRHIIATGYAGSLPGLPHCTDVGCDLDPQTGGCVRTVHAEQNAVGGAGRSVAGATAFVTLSPCLMCLKLLLAAGVRRVVYGVEYRVVLPQKELARAAGVEFVELKGVVHGASER